MNAKEALQDSFILGKIREQVRNALDDGSCKFIRFEYPQGSGREWKISCKYDKDRQEVVITLRRRT